MPKPDLAGLLPPVRFFFINFLPPPQCELAFSYRSQFKQLSCLAVLYGPTRFLQKALFSSPFVIVPTFIGEVEQDYYFWPFVYKKKAEHWREAPTWGQRFKK